MNYLKYTQYVYLVFSAFFIYDGFMKFNSEQSPWLSFIIAAVALFMFFFRRKFAKKFENRND
ncbi:hypothetical protein [Flavobacterium sp.]|uniref:hypothetical protein n=1 Tax=Flavobacterium sp. TaxID=239 RepID=UPI00286B8338|nr:hypothetical protein [Flavobacterium sp.]